MRCPESGSCLPEDPTGLGNRQARFTSQALGEAAALDERHAA